MCKALKTELDIDILDILEFNFWYWSKFNYNIILNQIYLEITAKVLFDSIDYI